MPHPIQDLRDHIRKAIESQQSRVITPLSSLLAVDDSIGYIPQEAVEEIAKFTKSTVNDVWGVASFYTNFRFTPPKKHNVEVCWGPTCHLSNAANILQSLQDTLGIQGEGETEDGKITLKYNTCLGACSQAPVISVDHQLFGNMTPEGACAKVEEAKASD